jgi:23S rRNA pseudouridine2605 synthase
MNPAKTPPLPPAPSSSSPAGQRLQKLLAAAGLGSRREIETWISAGRVSLRGQIAKLGDRAMPGDAILVDGKPVAAAPAARKPRLLLYHKPVGELVTRSDPQGRPTVFDRLPSLSAGRWVAVGRLDFNTAGLLLLTDSGELANRLMHPRTEIEREYEVRVQGGLSDSTIRRLLDGVALDDGPARFLALEEMKDRKHAGANRWYRVVLAEGRNREVRRLVEAVGARVSRLVRVRFGALRLPAELRPGSWVEIDARGADLP